ncbi:MAG TPA: M20 family metallopeptidase [Kiritimatiellia bacterium]|nr:M20 family metallopeptidase [Kiritimatiellia bacterium]
MEAEAQLLRELVSIPSVNPLLADDPDIAGEARLGSFVARWFDERGFRVSEATLTPGRPNVMARRGPEAPRMTVMFEAHLDTQGIHGMTVEPFAGHVVDGRMYGRGACDMKGAMAAAMTALDDPERLERLEAAGVAILFVGAIGEETGNEGALELAGMRVGADFAIVLEPTDLNLVRAHKGVAWMEVELVGRAAHGSVPEQGRNAIEGMMEFLDRFRAMDEVRFPPAHSLLGCPTLNVGKIWGGTSINIVAERCRVGLDRRMLPGEQVEEIVALAQAVVDEVVEAGYALEGSARLLKSGIAYETKADAELIDRLGAAIEAEGVARVVRGAGWYSDAGPFSRTCGEVVVFGPGSIDQAHTADEYIELEEVAKATRILARFLDHLALGAE